jgi:hypothetical protein
MKRVVQIGFHRCGTRSLAKLFADSGYEAAHWRVQRKNGKMNLARMLKKNIEAGCKPLHRLERYAFLSDLECLEDGKIWSGFLRFREIDAAYPGTQFLLNTRDKADWLQSRLTHRNYAQKFIAARGLSGIDECLAVWSADWDRHLADVRDYFRDRPADLVEFNIDTDSIDTLIAQLPAFDLDPTAWDHIGKSNPENVARSRAALDAFLAERS